MRKLLTIGALILSVNMFAAVSIIGPGLNMNIGGSIKGVSNYSLNAGTTTITLSGASTIDAGNTFTVASGGTLVVVNGAGQTVQTINGPAVVTLTQNLDANITAANASTYLSTGGSATPITPTTPPTPATPVTPTAPATSAKYYIPRSKVDLDLTRNITASGFMGLENAGNSESGTNLDIQYIGNIGRYTDNSNEVKYNTTSNGGAILGTKKFGNVTIGGGFGYQDSKVKYKENFDGIKENIGSYQFMLSGRYNFTENVDLSSVLTYSHNSHKYSSNGIFQDDIKFNSKIIDFQTRLGSKYAGNIGYVKPYIGLGITSVREGAIDGLGLQKASGTSANATLGVLGEVALGSAVDLFGNIEYQYRFNKKSYHRDRSFVNGSGYVEGLDYDSPFNLGVGLRYKFNSFNMTTAYEYKGLSDNVFKVGFGVEF